MSSTAPKGTIKTRSRRKQHTSLKEIAGITGYSIATVSMVVNGRAQEFNISDDTCALILAAAKLHNYQPNLHARSLRSGTTNIVGLMIPTLYNRFFSEMAETFEGLARSDKKLALITVTNYDKQEEINTINYFLSQKVECIFTANPMALERVSDLCTRAGTKQILLDSEKSAKHTISTDNVDAAKVLTRLLLSSLAADQRAGRIYYVGGMAEHKITQHRLAGFKAALQECGLSYTDDQFIETPFDAQSAYCQIKTLFEAKDDISGLFFNSLPPLDGLARFFPEAPQQCRAIHYGVFDYDPIMSLLDLHVVAIRQNPGAMMQKAYAIFASDQIDETATTHYVPYDIVATPAIEQIARARG